MTEPLHISWTTKPPILGVGLAVRETHTKGLVRHGVTSDEFEEVVWANRGQAVSPAFNLVFRYLALFAAGALWRAEPVGC